jgi:LPS-assembly lipoprotein
VIERRHIRLWSLAAMLALAGCGFRPVYGPGAAGAPAPAVVGLSQIHVALLPERSGQMMRDALQRRLELNGVRSPLYELAVTFYVAQDGASIERNDSVPTRIRAAGIAAWTLTSADAEQRTITSGRVRTPDGNNPLDLQYFYSELQGEQMQKRLVEAAADEIALQLASWFALHPPAG